MTHVQLSHDPFGRMSFMRQLNPDRRGTCAWCGSRPARFVYGWQNDGASASASRTHWDTRSFCSVGCRRAYYS